MKKVLIISPYFPPSNAADMHRIRMSLPYFKDFGWEAEVVSVDPKHSDMLKDPLLMESVPADIRLHRVEAFSKKWTRKFGLGSLALRSMWFYKQKVNRLLKQKNYDLIYFSTTQFPLCILGPYWKKRFGIPYVIDMQDPWHSEYYRDKPKDQRPAKYWFSYRLNKWLEPLAIKTADGLISVSEGYIHDLKNRYPAMKDIPASVITFGAFAKDFEIAALNKNILNPAFQNTDNFIHIIYVGRGGHDMQGAVRLLFVAFKNGLLKEPERFKKIRFHFIGTSYATPGAGKQTIYPLALELGISKYVEEQTDRISFYQCIRTLMEANALIVPGSDDPKYTASKIYPYLLARKPLLAIFNPLSSAAKIIRDCQAGTVANLNAPEKSIDTIYSFLFSLNIDPLNTNQTNWDIFKEYSAENMTRRQCQLFNRAVASD